MVKLAAGHDEIMAELLKHWGETVVKELVFNHVW